MPVLLMGRMCPPFRVSQTQPLFWEQDSSCPWAWGLLLFKGSCIIVYFGCNQAWPINTEMAHIKMIKLSELFPLMSPFIHYKGNSRMNCQRSFALLSRFRRIKKLQRSPSAEFRSGSGLVKTPLASKLSLQHWSVNSIWIFLQSKPSHRRKFHFRCRRKFSFHPHSAPRFQEAALRGWAKYWRIKHHIK